MRGEGSCPFCGAVNQEGRRGRALFAAVAMGLALGGCADDGVGPTTQTMTTSDGVESDSAGEATYGVPITDTGDDTDPFGVSSSTTGGPETDTDTDADTESDSGGSSSSGELGTDTDTDTDAGTSSSSGGGTSSSTSG